MFDEDLAAVSNAEQGMEPENVAVIATDTTDVETWVI
jgi:hypothetical protein